MNVEKMREILHKQSKIILKQKKIILKSGLIILTVAHRKIGKRPKGQIFLKRYLHVRYNELRLFIVMVSYYGPISSLDMQMEDVRIITVNYIYRLV